MKKKITAAVSLVTCLCMLLGGAAFNVSGSQSGDTQTTANPYGNVWYWTNEEAYGQFDSYGSNEQDIEFTADLCLLPDADVISTANFMTADGGGGVTITKYGVKISSNGVSYDWGTPSWDNWHRIKIVIHKGSCSVSIDGEELVKMARGIKAYTDYQLLFSTKGSMAIDNVSLKKTDGTVYFTCNYENPTDAAERMGTGLGSLKSYDKNELSDIEWKYLDTNTDPAAGLSSSDAWTGEDYDDSAWKTGMGGFGAKDGQLADVGDGIVPDTLLTQYIPGTVTNIPAYFFRAEIDIDDPDFIFEIDGSILYDDSATVYINGVRIASFDEPEGGYASNMSYGGSNAGTPKIGVIASTEVGVLHKGKNTIAVELHQGSEDSSDIYMSFLSLSFDKTPSQSSIMLTPGSDETSVNFAWYSTNANAGALRYAKAQELVDGKLPADAASVSSEVGQSNLEGSWYNRATAAGLESGTDYCYQLSNGVRKTEVYTFTTQDSGAFSFLFVGDPQIGAGSSSTSDGTAWENSLRVMTENFADSAFLLSAGDQVNSASDEEQYGAYIENDYLKSLINPTVVGNHDSGSDSYSQHFNIANESTEYGTTSAGGDAWFMYNGVLFLQLNDNNMSTAEHKAFMKDAIGRNNAEWIVAVMHHSLYSVANHAFDSDVLRRRSDLSPLFQELGVDVVLMGHDHVYCRTYMIDGVNPITDSDYYDDDSYSSVTDSDGILYLTANSGSGSKYYDIKNTAFPYAAVKNQEYTPTFSDISVSKGSFSIVTYRVNDLSVMDSFTINRTVVPEAADYSGVEAAKASVPEDLSVYTSESVDRLLAALGNVTDGKTADEQSEVDKYEADILGAISSLTYKIADYTEVDGAIGRIPADLSIYEDEGVAALKDALAKVERDKIITEQSEVDGYAAKLNEALTALRKKAAPAAETVNPPKDSATATQETVSPEQKRDESTVSPQTGDVNIVMLIVLLAVSVLSLSATVLYRLKSPGERKESVEKRKDTLKNK